MPNPLLPPCKHDHVRATVLPDGRWLLFNNATRAATTVSAAAGILWELCDGATPLPALLDELATYYPDTPRDDLAAQTDEMLAYFAEHDLIANHDA
jgi:hypothetical protein